MVSVLTYNSYDPSSNLDEFFSFLRFNGNKNKKEEARVGSY